MPDAHAGASMLKTMYALPHVPTASGGVSNKTNDTPSDAAIQAAYENTKSDKSVGPPLSRGVS